MMHGWYDSSIAVGNVNGSDDSLLLLIKGIASQVM